MSVPATVALPVLKELISAAAQYQMCKEHEKTERMRIEAQLEACLATINKNHENFLRAMDDNRSYITQAYDATEKLLDNPAVCTNPILLQQVLDFLQNAHATHSNNFIAVVNANAMPLPRIR